ncbi:MAG TPA: cupin domain-containing protein [Vicinamibacterales bacterium]|jgi:mannose-6-phosphate isomerase-like protein (cupin superfamily)
MTRALVFCLAFVAAAATASTQETKKKGGYIVQHDADVAKNEPGPHQGPGQTVGYVFFEKTPNLHFSFRKRVLKPGAGIGYHEQHEDEVYYVLSGRGVMTLDGTPTDVGPGAAILTRTGSSHGLKQVGAEDLVVIIAFETK